MIIIKQKWINAFSIFLILAIFIIIIYNKNRSFGILNFKYNLIDRNDFEIQCTSYTQFSTQSNSFQTNIQIINEILEIFYVNYNNAFEPKITTNFAKSFHRNQATYLFRLFSERSNTQIKLNNFVLIDIGIGNNGLNSLVAASSGQQVVAVSSDNLSLQILYHSLNNISKSLIGIELSKRIIFCENPLLQITHLKNTNTTDTIKILESRSNINLNNKKNRISSFRLSDINISNKLMNFIVNIDLELVELKALFDIFDQSYKIKMVILNNWNKVWS